VFERFFSCFSQLKNASSESPTRQLAGNAYRKGRQAQNNKPQNDVPICIKLKFFSC